MDKLRTYFDHMAVYKDLKTNDLFSTLSLPAFMRDWLLRRFEDENGLFDATELMAFVHRFIPKKEEWKAIKSRIVKDNERVKCLAKISVEIDIRSGDISFSLPDFGLSVKETIVEDNVWQSCKQDLIAGSEVWGMLELGYRPPTTPSRRKSRAKYGWSASNPSAPTPSI